MIDPGIASALITGSLTALGGGIAWVRARFKAKDTAFEQLKQAKDTALEKTETKLQTRIDQLEREIKLLETAADTKDETIADLRSQRDRLVITAEIQDKFFRQLPPPRRITGEQDG